MQRRTMAALSLVLLAATALSACTSDDSETPEDGTTTSAAAAAEGVAPADGEWWCRLIKRDSVEAATGGRADEALELLAVDELDEYRCDVLLPTSGEETEVAMSLSIHRNIPGEADARLAEVQSLEGATPGPDHLGVSYFADTLGVAVVPCKGQPESSDAETEVPYVFTIRAQLDTDGAATAFLDEPLTRMVREMDQSVGCSPSKVHESDESGATEGPADDEAVTTAP